MCRESGTTFSRPGNYSYFGMRNYDFERGQGLTALPKSRFPGVLSDD